MSNRNEGKPSTGNTKNRTIQLYMCPCCQGTGDLTKKEHGYVGWLFECAEWVLKLQKNIKAARAEEQDNSPVNQAASAFETFYSALAETGKAGEHSTLSKEDLDFLRDLDKEPKN